MGQRRPTLLLAVLGAALAATGSASAASWSNYQGKGEINISVQDVNMNIQVEQTFRKPGQMVLHLDVFGLKQMIFMDGSVEQTYNPAQGVLIETRYLNLEKAEVNPMVGAPFVMETMGRALREAKSAKTTGKETLLGCECDLIEVDTQEILQRFGGKGILGNKKLLGALGSRVKAWISREWEIPLQLELPGADGKPAMTFKFTELKVNSDAVKERLGLLVPNGTRRVTVTADLADPEWEAKMNAEVKKALTPPTKAPAEGGKKG